MSNTPIEDLIAIYEDEGCPHDDLEWVCSTALRLVETMPDSQARCLLHVLAKHVQERHISRSTADHVGVWL